MQAFMDAAPAKIPWWERNWKRVLALTLGIAALATAGWFFFRHWNERKVADTFVATLQQKKYEDAYKLWGCSVQKPCETYSYQNFLEDWGPKGIYPDANRLKQVKTRHCNGGIIQDLQYGSDYMVQIFVSTDTMTMSFSPWPICDPRIPVKMVRGS